MPEIGHRARRRFAGVLAGMVIAVSPSAADELEKPVKMRQLVGERLAYRIAWGGVPVGRATMEVGLGPLPWLVEMRSTAVSLPALNLIYPVDDRVISRAASANLRAKEYLKVSREGFSRRERRHIQFDPKGRVAGTVVNDRRKPWLTVPKGVLDPLSAIYAYRVHPAPDGKPPELPVTDGEKVVLARMEIGGFERLKTPAGSFDTVIVMPRIEGLGGIFRRSPDATIRLWITRDRWRRLVKMQTQVAIGEVTVELTGITEPTGAPRPGVLAKDWEKWRPRPVEARP